MNMKRIKTTAIQALLFIILCLFLGLRYISKNPAPTIDNEKPDVKSPIIPYTSPPTNFATSTTRSVAALPTQAEPIGVVESTFTSSAARTRSLDLIASSNPVRATPTTELKAGNRTLLQEASQYVHAIINAEDTTFPRLACPAPTSGRYDYLKTSPASSATVSRKSKYFFALDLYECAPILPRLLGTVVETIRFLGPENCALSVVEGRSTDGTFEILKSLRVEIESIGTQYFFTTSDVDPKAGEGTDRIAALAGLRNLALQPLVDFPGRWAQDSTIIFINDVSICMEDLLELIHQRVFLGADMTCAMDWIYGGAFFYDVWVSRGINGDQFFEVPQSGSWDYAGNLFWNDPSTRTRLDAMRPYQVFACWNGATAFTAKPILTQQVKFRTVYDHECYHGEPTLFCKDMWYHGYRKIAVVPSINVGYDDEESQKVKAAHGTVAEWAAKEEANELPLSIEWAKEPPATIKCVPTYQRPSWVPWDEALKEQEKVRDGALLET